MNVSAHIPRRKDFFLAKEVTGMAKDPVCNMQVDEQKAAGSTLYKGVTYFFCAKGCKEKFDKDPEKYLPKKQG
jgi:YHS domain-containing protein